MKNGSLLVGETRRMQLALLILAMMSALLATYVQAQEFELDERLTMPRNTIAYDSGIWSANTPRTTLKRDTLSAVPRPAVDGESRGTYLDTCSAFGLMWHPQHVVRLPNKNGRAYFMVSNSHDAAVAPYFGGWITLVETDPGAIDPETDLIRGRTDLSQQWIVTSPPSAVPGASSRSRIQQDYWQGQNGGYLDAYENSGNDYSVVTRPDQANTSQDWDITVLVDRENGAFVATLRQVSSNRYLDAYEGNGGDDAFSSVTRPRQQGDPTQEWIFTPVAGEVNTYTIQQGSVAERYLDAVTDSITGGNAVTRPLQTQPVGQFTWFDQYSPSNRTRAGQYNHPGKMELVGGMLIVAAQNWLPTDESDLGIICGGDRGTSADALLFYDVRDPQNPKYWGKIEASELALGASSNNGRQVIDAVTLNRLVGTKGGGAVALEEWFMTAGGGNFRNLKANPEALSITGGEPSQLWEWTDPTANPEEGGNFNIAARNNGMSFSSYQMESVFDQASSPPAGVDRNIYFNGYNVKQSFEPLVSSDFRFKFQEYLFFDNSASTEQRTGNEVDVNPYLLPESYDYKDWDADSMYVTPNGMPVAYTVDSAGRILQVYDTQNLSKPAPPLGNKVVTNTNDRGPGSLRQAIGYGGNISFDLPDGDNVITLENGPLVAVQLDVDIDGCSTPGGVIISGDGKSRVLEIGEDVAASLACVTITNGFARQGAGILNMGGAVSLDRVTVTNNIASWPYGIDEDAGDGGGILNGINQLHWFDVDQTQCLSQASPVVCQSTDSGRDVQVKGQNYGGTMFVIDSTISNNSAGRYGGGIANFGADINVFSSTISGNTAGWHSGTDPAGRGTGGGVYNRDGFNSDDSERPGNAVFVNSTVSGNLSAEFDGVGGTAGIENTGGGYLYMVHSTVADNISDELPFAAGIRSTGASTVILENTIVANNTWVGSAGQARDVNGFYIATAANLFSDNSGAIYNGGAGGAAIVGDPLLASLADNGGLTQTMLPLTGSPAIDAATPGNVPQSIDQRGLPRPAGGFSDLGSAERQSNDVVIDTDGDGVPDSIDPDDDNDGVPDELDDYPLGRFDDARPGDFAFSFIEALARSGISVGCGGANYCPNATVTRAQMAVFLERGMRGSSYSPPAASGTVFNDVGAGDFAAAWIEQLFADGITSGCGGGNYCSDNSVTRAQMAVFLLRAKYGSGYAPPAATGAFTDVPQSNFAINWIEQLAAEGITSGCGVGIYCPDTPVTRAQMAVFLVRTFGL